MTVSKSDSSLPASLRTARWAASAVLLGCLLLAAALSGHFILRANPREQAAARWMKSLDLSMPALWPSGTLWRAPESATPAVDPRLTPVEMDLEEHAAFFGWRLKRALDKGAP